MISAAAKATRLEKMRNFLRKCAGEILRRSLKSVEELEAAEAAKDIVLPSTSILSVPIASIDPNLAKALSFFDPSDLY